MPVITTADVAITRRGLLKKDVRRKWIGYCLNWASRGGSAGRTAGREANGWMATPDRAAARAASEDLLAMKTPHSLQKTRLSGFVTPQSQHSIVSGAAPSGAPGALTAARTEAAACDAGRRARAVTGAGRASVATATSESHSAQ